MAQGRRAPGAVGLRSVESMRETGPAMLRRKLLLVLGSLVALFVVAAVSAILLLHAVLRDLNELSTAALSATTQTALLGATMTTIEAELNELRLRPDAPRDTLVDAALALNERIERLGELPVMPANGGPCYRRIRAQLPAFNRHVADLAATANPELAEVHTDLAMKASAALRADIAEFTQTTQDQTERALQKVIRNFRWTGVGVGIVFLMLINVSIMVLLRAAAMILKPVDRLVEASRRLAREEFDYRVQFDRHDEFDELAGAYNGLAEQLQSNEQRKVETLHQVARTLNHELNNAIAIIELQLRLVAKTAGGDRPQAENLREIHQALGRMNHTVEALKRVRRIVLTDYTSGVKMLDLERSVEEEPSPGGSAAPSAIKSGIQ
ncbi:MAG: HAMP domain-containing protein [Planctomycetota bacterium]